MTRYSLKDLKAIMSRKTMQGYGVRQAGPVLNAWLEVPSTGDPDYRPTRVAYEVELPARFDEKTGEVLSTKVETVYSVL